MSATDRLVVFEVHLADITLRRILRPYLRASAYHIVVLMPENVDKLVWFSTAQAIFKSRSPEQIDFDDFSSPAAGTVLLVDSKSSGSAAAKHQRVLSLVVHDAHDRIDDVARAGATKVVSIGEITPALVHRVAAVRLKRMLPLDVAARLAAMPARDRDYLMRPGINTVRAVTSLPVATEEKPEPMPAVPSKSSSPCLEDLHGYGEAKSWGLQLAQDLRDYREGVISWDDVDRGLLLSGPPGCGKTTYAAALAQTCGVHLELASYGAWYKGGDGQGALIRTMRASFSRAIDNAPSILLIDEIDSFADRDRQPDRYADWSRQVVNALLDCLDGAGGREGVVVVGACNNPAIVDPAIKRSGRLDRHIRIPLPDSEARGAILRWHLQATVAVGEAVKRTEGASGADLERIARDARRVARRERRTVTADDVLASLPERKPYSPEQLRSTAIHEAGHAVVGVVLNVLQLRHVEIDPTYAVTGAQRDLGAASWLVDGAGRRDRTHYQDLIAMTLGGIAAETLIVGGHCDGAAQDLAQASTWAAAMVGAYGMDGRLVAIQDVDVEAISRSLRIDRVLAEAVDRILQTQRVRAAEIVEDYRDVVEALADRLVAEHRIDGTEVVEMVHRAQARDRVRLA